MTDKDWQSYEREMRWSKFKVALIKLGHETLKGFAAAGIAFGGMLP